MNFPCLSGDTHGLHTLGDLHVGLLLSHILHRVGRIRGGAGATVRCRRAGIGRCSHVRRHRGGRRSRIHAARVHGGGRVARRVQHLLVIGVHELARRLAGLRGWWGGRLVHHLHVIRVYGYYVAGTGSLGRLCHVICGWICLGYISWN